MDLTQMILPLVKNLRIGALFGDKDSNLENPLWTEADFKVVILFNGDFFTKQSSATLIQLVQLIRLAEERTGKKIYVDFAYQPTMEEVEILREAKVPVTFGWSSFRTLDEFDLISVSFSIHFEILNIYQHWLASGIKPFFLQRVNNPEVPFIISGGNVATHLEPLHGGKEGSLVDVVYIGEAEDRLPAIVEFLVRDKSRLRNDKLNLIKDLTKEFDNLYFPNGYVHNYKGTVIESIDRVYDWVPERVKFHRSFDRKPPMFEKRLAITSNDSAGRGELMIAKGAICGESEIETSKGKIRIKDIAEGYKDYKSVYDHEPLFIRSVHQPSVKFVKTRKGYVLGFPSKVLVVRDRFLKEVDVEDLVIGDIVAYRSNCDQRSLNGVEEKSFYSILGWQLGDGGRIKHGSKIQGFRLLSTGQDSEGFLEEQLRLLNWVYSKTEHSYNKRKDCKFKIFNYNVNLRELDKNILSALSEGCKKEIPEEFFRQSNRENIYALLRCLFETDGGVYLKSTKITFASSSEELSKQVQTLLLTVGIESSRKAIKPSGKGKKVMYDVTVTDNFSRMIFKSFIGFVSGKKIKTLSEFPVAKKSGLYLYGFQLRFKELVRGVSKLKWVFDSNNQVRISYDNMAALFNGRAIPDEFADLEKIYKLGLRVDRIVELDVEGRNGYEVSYELEENKLSYESHYGDLVKSDLGFVKACRVWARGSSDSLRLMLEGGRYLDLTLDHQVRVCPGVGSAGSSFIAVKDLIVGKHKVKTVEGYRDIVSIKSVGVKDMYDISVPEGGRFWANGILTHNCSQASCHFSVWEGERVWTQKGLRRLKDIVVGFRAPIEEKVDTHMGWRRATKSYTFEVEKQCLKLEFKSGRVLVLTPEHKMKVWNPEGRIEFKEARELVVGDVVPVALGSQFVRDRPNFSKEYEFLGRMVGDGTYNSKISLFSNDKESSYCRDLLNGLGVLFTESKKDREVVEFYLKPKNNVRKRFGFKKYEEEGKRIPETVFSAPVGSILSFIKGWFEADGSVYNNGNIVVATASLILARDLQALCSYIGVRTTINKSVIKNRDYEPFRMKDDGGSRVIYRVVFETRFNKLLAMFDDIQKPVRILSDIDYDSLPVVEKLYKELYKKLGFKVVRTKRGEFRNIPVRFLKIGLKDKETVEFLSKYRVVKDEVKSIVVQDSVPVADIEVPGPKTFITGGFVVSNCSEGSEGGVWREYDAEAIHRGMDIIKKYNAPNLLSFFSLNSNYKSDIFDLYHEVAKKFSYISVIALRADVVGAVPEYISLLKTLGTFRITIALEGISDRVRNLVLGKSLPWELFLNACENVFKARFIMLKMNIILSGYETEADMNEFLEYLGKVVKLREEIGAKTSLMFSVTTLVTYTGVGLRWSPRKSTVCEILRSRPLKEMISKARELGTRWRFNSGQGFIFQQLLVDGARKITDVALPIYEEAWSKNEDVNTESYFRRLNEAGHKALGLETQEDIIKFYDRERPYEEIFADHVFEVQPEKMKKLQYERVHKKLLQYCLATPANPHPKCYGCGMCPSEEFKQTKVIKRNFNSKATLQDIQKEIFLNRPQSALRVIYRVKGDPLSMKRQKLVESHFIASRFLRVDNSLFEAFYGVDNYSDKHLTEDGQPDGFSGLSMFDIKTRLSPDALQSLPLVEIVSKVNKQVECAQVERVFPVFSGALPDKMKFLYGFRTRLTKSALVEAFSSYDGKIKTLGGDGCQSTIELVSYGKDEFSLYIIQKPTETIGLFTLYYRYNPYYALSSFFKQHLKKIPNLFQISREGMYSVVDVPCKGCSNRTYFSYYNNKVLTYCPDCLAKVEAVKLSQDEK